MNGSTGFEFPVLICDIGGTNARFQIIEQSGDNPVAFDPVRTANFTDVESAIRNAVLANTPIQPRSAIIAAAGPITRNGLNLTNCHWNITPDSFLNLASFTRLVLMNDFEAQALALPCLTASDGLLLGEATGTQR